MKRRLSINLLEGQLKTQIKWRKQEEEEEEEDYPGQSFVMFLQNNIINDAVLSMAGLAFDQDLISLFLSLYGATR